MKLSPSVRKFFAAAGKKGGKNRAKSLSAARRREIASLGGIARKKVLDAKAEPR